MVRSINKVFIILLITKYSFCQDQVDNVPDDLSVDDHNVKVGERVLSAQIFAIIEHYKQEDPVGLPGATIPDPLPVPDIKQSFTLATIHMKNVLAYGLSKFKIKNMEVDINELKAVAGVQIDLMTIRGNYTMSSLFSRASGPFTITLKNVFVQGNADLAVERDGKIKTHNIAMDFKFSDMSMDFQNLGFMGTIFQGIVNSAPNIVFDTIKPLILKEAYTQFRTIIDSKIGEATTEYHFSNTISPLDMAIADLRKKVRDMGYDPFAVRDYNHTVGLFAMEMTHTWLTGGSSFYRVGNISVAIQNNTVILGMQIGTQKIMGSTQWEVSVAKGMITRAGHVQFSVQHVNIAFIVSQTLDVRNRPQMKDLQLELGNIQIRHEGAGTMDYVIEFVINVLPNLLRYQIMDAIENPLKIRIQELMNNIDVEKIIREKVPDFEDNGLNMSFDFIF